MVNYLKLDLDDINTCYFVDRVIKYEYCFHSVDLVNKVVDRYEALQSCLPDLVVRSNNYLAIHEKEKHLSIIELLINSLLYNVTTKWYIEFTESRAFRRILDSFTPEDVISSKRTLDIIFILVDEKKMAPVDEILEFFVTYPIINIFIIPYSSETEPLVRLILKICIIFFRQSTLFRQQLFNSQLVSFIFDWIDESSFKVKTYSYRLLSTLFILCNDKKVIGDMIVKRQIIKKFADHLCECCIKDQMLILQAFCRIVSLDLLDQEFQNRIIEEFSSGDLIEILNESMESNHEEIAMLASDLYCYIRKKFC